MRTRVVRTAVLGAALIALTACASAQTTRLPIPADWKAAEQPDLKAQLDQAPPLKVENLGSPVKALDFIETNLIPNGHGWDFLIWYREGYRRNTRVYMVDLSNGQIKKQAFPQDEGKVRTENGFTWFGVFAGDGKLYGVNQDWSQVGQGKPSTLLVYCYDPATREVKVVHKIVGHGGERNPAVISPNGWIYGAGSYDGPNAKDKGKASAWGWNPATGEFKDFGAVGKNTGMGYGYFVAADDTHVYVDCGANPWYLVAVNVQTGEQKILETAPDGAYTNRIYLNTSRQSLPGFFGGAMAYVQKSDDAPRKYYWVWHGELIPKKQQSFEMDDSCPWPRLPSPMEKLGGTPPEVFDGQLYPDEKDQATVWWRPKAGAGEWQKITVDGVEKHPMGVHRLAALPDGRLFGVSAGYQGRFIHDPKTGKSTEVGAQGGGSIYAMLEHAGKVYWSGYPSGPIYVYDPAKPWTMRQAGPPGGSQPITETAADSNPRRCTWDGKNDIVFLKTRVKKMLSATVPGDGRIYFGGKGQRDYEGGGLSWLDLKTGQIDGLWKPFDNREIGWVTPAGKGRYVVIGTEGLGGGAPAKVFVYDTAEGKVVGDFVPVEKARKSGPLLEVADGLMLGETHDPNVKGGGVLYAVKVPSGEVVFRKPIPAGIPFDWAQGLDKWDYKLGPDGFIWTVLGKTLVRIDPRDASIHAVGKAESIGQFVFVGRDLYMSGANALRVVRNVVPEK